MPTLWKKLFRDLWALRSQSIAIAVVVAAGISVFYALMGTYDSLTAAQADYYAQHRLADVFARVVRAPRSVAESAAAIPGVAEVRARVVLDVSADIPGLDEPASMHLISMPRARDLNGVHLRRGTPPERADDIVINEIFAEADHLDVGSVIGATVHGKRRALRVVGIGMSPEFVFQVHGADLVPDNRRFGVAWMEPAALAAAADMTGAFNEMVISLAAGAREQDVITALDELLAPWGSLGAQGRREGLLSHRVLTDKLAQLRASARMVPSVFLAVAAFLLNVVLGRLVATQRVQIGTLKAFGMSDAQVGGHYLAFVLVIVVLGAALGAAVGTWLGGGLCTLYQGYYRFPDLQFRADPATLPGAVIVAVVAASGGALGAVRRATALPPAEAMRPEPPPAFHGSAVDRPALRRLLSTGARMAVRNLLRRPARTVLSITGIALAAVIVVLVGAMGDSIRSLIDLQFNEVQRADATVAFFEPRDLAAAHEIARIPGVMRVEPFRALPVVLHHRHLYYRTALTGAPRDGELRRVVEASGRVVAIPEEGVILSRVLAGKLGLGAGDQVDVEILEGERRTRALPVSAVVDDLIGVSAIMDLDALARFAKGSALISGAELRLDTREEARVIAALRGRGQIAGVVMHQAALDSFRDQLDKSLGVMQRIEVIFAFIIAFAVVFNGARTALSERARELCTLRVLGFSDGEVAMVLLGELFVVTALAIPFGLILGDRLALALLRASASDLIRLPVVVSGATFSTAALVVAASAIVSAVVVGSRVGGLDLVGVLKTRD